MNSLYKIFNRLKIVRIDLIFFYLFLLTSTLSVRKIIYRAKIDAPFNEYTSAYIYLSDIFLICCFLLFIIYNKNTIKSNYSRIVHMFHVEQMVEKFESYTWNKKLGTKNYVSHGTKINVHEFYTQVIHNYLLIFPLVAVFFSFFSILWTSDQIIGLFRAIKLAEFVFLFYYIIFIVSRRTIDKKNVNPNIAQKSLIKCFTWNKGSLQIVSRETILFFSFSIIILNGFVNSVIAIFQVVTQRSLGLIWLKESIIANNIAGVAKIIVDDENYIRAYGLMPHPNILGGYLILSLACSYLIFKMFYVEQQKIQSPGLYNIKMLGSTWNNQKTHLFGLFFIVIFAVQIIALILTASKSAILGLTVGYIVYLVKNVPRETRFCKMFHVKQISLLVLITIMGSLILLKNGNADIKTFLFKSLNERNFYLNVSRETLISHPFIGLGAGQFVENLSISRYVESWQLQPVHNVFLLIANEYGLFMAFFYVFFLLLLCQEIVSRGTDKTNPLIAVLFSYLFIMLFDHYLWDIQQGMIILWLLLGVLVARQQLTKKQ